MKTFLFIVVTTSFFLTGCIQSPQEITLRVQEIEFRVEVAKSPGERAQGLQGREKLGENKGMLFVFNQAHIPQFWMKDTRIPLDIAFIDTSWTIVDIQQMEPNSVKLHSPDQPIKYALEMNQGWFEKKGISLGDKMAIKKCRYWGERGF